MPYQILPNILFIFAILGIILMILRHLPEVISNLNEHERPIEKKLWQKGLPARAVSSVRVAMKSGLGNLWNFMLEAKDLKPNGVTGYKIRKMFQPRVINKPNEVVAVEKLKKSEMVVQPVVAVESHIVTPEVKELEKNEEYFLELIKKDPKNLAHYNDLGKFYLESGNMADATDIYRYMSSHEPNNAEFQSRLAYCYYLLHEYTRASEHYKKSIALDPSQPNRYYNLGVSLEADNQLEDAVKNLEQAVSIEPKNIKYYLTLSNVYVKLGYKDKARAVLLKAKKQEPDNRQIFEKLKVLV